MANKINYTNDSVQFIAKHMPSGIGEESPKKRDELIKQCLIEYHQCSCESRKKELRDIILLNIWYLFPYVLSSYKLKGHIFDDTLQLMILTTMKAIDNFKPNLGHKFSSYISGYLKDAISMSLKSTMVVKCPAQLVKAQEILHLKLMVGDADSEEEYDSVCSKKTNYTELSIDNDITLTEISSDIVNKNKPTGLCSRTVENEIIDMEENELLHKAIGLPGLLTKKERIVLIYRFGLSGVPRLTLTQVASIFRSNGNRASKVWIFQIEQKAKAKLKRYFIRNRLV